MNEVFLASFCVFNLGRKQPPHYRMNESPASDFYSLFRIAGAVFIYIYIKQRIQSSLYARETFNVLYYWIINIYIFIDRLLLNTVYSIHTVWRGVLLLSVSILLYKNCRLNLKLQKARVFSDSLVDVKNSTYEPPLKLLSEELSLGVRFFLFLN